MVEGPVTWFKNYEIIRSKADEKYYVYNSLKDVMAVHDSLTSAKFYLIKHITGAEVSNLRHEGVLVFEYDYIDKLYLLSVTQDILKKYPDFITMDYNNVLWMRDLFKYLHNEKGPASLCLDTKEALYFWNGEKLKKEDWQKKASAKTFDSKWDDFLK